ncbi:hypothetical protein L226DRAFT_150369 [Lentinus tigrinus ALCF2SS1-7]|uniref:uncharacterized protein n=1 Tax=Lentinus tigrinus ALCF2SS1-7 TaxID=1328758 RepID=UPI001166014E|nr:hypothetical protein L226DRAFT_150369 [Lentinus tigrinus ALCF2SS1-7]
MMIQLSLISTTWVVAGRSGRVIMLRHKSVDTTNLHVMSVWTQAGCAQGMSRGCNVAFQEAANSLDAQLVVELRPEPNHSPSCLLIGQCDTIGVFLRVMASTARVEERCHFQTLRQRHVTAPSQMEEWRKQRKRS